MTRSPSKRISLERLEAIKANNYIAENGKEFSAEETDALIMRKLNRKIDAPFDFGAVEEIKAPAKPKSAPGFDLAALFARIGEEIQRERQFRLLYGQRFN